VTRALSYTPEHGPFLTLGDLEDFIRDARAKGFPERQQIRVTGHVEVNIAHGPRATRITAVPDEVTDD